MGKVIMAVDDSASVRQMVSFTLKAAGYEVVTAVDGQDALSKMNGRPIHLVVTDLKMPLVDGIDLIDIIKKIDDTVPIIIITAYGTIETAEEAIQKGAYDFITKPFRKENILITIKRALEWKKMQGELAAMKSPRA